MNFALMILAESCLSEERTFSLVTFSMRDLVKFFLFPGSVLSYSDFLQELRFATALLSYSH